LSGTSDLDTYTIGNGNHSPVGFTSQLYVYDLSGRLNGTESDSVVIGDDTLPEVNNFSYAPNASDDVEW